MKNLLAGFVFILSVALPLLSTAGQPQKEGEFYQITIYHFSTADQQKLIDQYLQEAYLPALHRMKIKNIGVFTAIANDTATDKRLYIIIPVKSLEQVAQFTARLGADNEYLANGKTYLEAAYKTPPFNRLENILLKAFPLAPFMNLPKLTSSNTEKMYELRSYESATEKIFQNKVEMFNQGGEIDLFKKLNFNAVFYASVIAGSRMPNLMYMTSFENMADRDAHWKSFSAAPEWKTLSAKPEYQNNVSKIDDIFMRATTYSDY